MHLPYKTDAGSGGRTHGMAAMPKHSSDRGHFLFFERNVSYNCVYLMCLREANYCESHHSEGGRGGQHGLCRDPSSCTLLRANLCSCVWKIGVFNSDTELGNVPVSLICLAEGTVIANDWINKSQCCHCKSKRSSLFPSQLISSNWNEPQHQGIVCDSIYSPHNLCCHVLAGDQISW